MLVIYPPAAETVVTVTRAVDEESRDVFNSNGEVYENACDLPPAAAETVVAVTRAVDEESRDVHAGVLRYLISLTIHCSVFCKVNYQ